MYIGYDSQQDCHNATPCDDTIDPCFTPETLVTMADNTKKEISELAPNIKINTVACDVSTNEG